MTISQRLLRNMWTMKHSGVIAKHSDDARDLAHRGKLLALSGNFADPHPHVALKACGKNVTLALPKNPLESLSNYAALHIRGGDYFELGDSFGVLSEEYYRRGLEILPDGLPVVVLTNDVAHANQVISGLDISPQLVFGPSELSPLQSLAVLSNASAVIAANSSFSWWGAELSLTNQIKIAPATYTPMSDSNWMVHEGWTSIPASWRQS